MKSLLFNLKSMILVSLLLLSMLARGQGSNSSEQFVDYGDPTMSLVIYYNAIPDRLFIQKRSDVSKDYIISLLNELTNSQFEISWCPKEGYQDDYCRVIVDDIFLDSIIDSLLNDDGVLQARRIYVKKGDFDDYLYFIDQSGADFVELLDPILMGTEMWFLNSITCTPKDYNPDLVPISSISDDLNLTFIMVGTSIQFISQKNADIFELQHQLFETGYFIRVSPSFIIPYSDLELDFGDLSGIDVNKSDHFFYYFGDTKKYYYEVPDRIIIEKSDDVTHEYVNTQLNRLINHEFYIRWFAGGTICEVIVDDELASYVIDEMLKDDGVLFACHVYVSKDNYDKYLYYPYLEIYEECFLNAITCWLNGTFDQTEMDILCEELGLTMRNYGGYVIFDVPKNADIFEVSQQLYESGCFSNVEPLIVTPSLSWTEVRSSCAEAQVTYFYDMSGRKVDSPSGLTIVVKYYSDGTVRREKKLFK